MKKYVVTLAITGVLLTGSAPSLARAETTGSNTSIEALMKQIQALQEQIKALKGEVETLRSGLKEGSSNDDVKKIQELLATDPSIYPGGLMTGFFGPMTKEAVKRFQEKHGLPVTGEIDEATKKLMQEYFKERQNGRFPEGLLKKDGIRELMKNRMGEKPKFKIENIRVVCKDKTKTDCPVNIKERMNDDDDDLDEDEDDDNDIRRNRGQFASSSAMTADIAEEMIEDAEAAVNDLKEEIESATDNKVKAKAKAKLRQVESLLRTAKNHLTAKRYVPAYNNANQAEDKALDALEDLVEDEDKDDDDDDDEDEDDDEDDEDEDDDSDDDDDEDEDEDEDD